MRSRRAPPSRALTGTPVRPTEAVVEGQVDALADQPRPAVHVAFVRIEARSSGARSGSAPGDRLPTRISGQRGLQLGQVELIQRAGGTGRSSPPTPGRRRPSRCATITCSLATPVSRAMRTGCEADAVDPHGPALPIASSHDARIRPDLRAVLRPELGDRRPDGAPDDGPQRQRLLDGRHVRRPAVPRPERLERTDEPPVARARPPLGRSGRCPSRVSDRRGSMTASPDVKALAPAGRKNGAHDSASPQIQSRGWAVRDEVGKSDRIRDRVLDRHDVRGRRDERPEVAGPDGRVADVGDDRQPGDGVSRALRGSDATPPATGMVRWARGPSPRTPRRSPPSPPPAGRSPGRRRRRPAERPAP